MSNLESKARINKQDYPVSRLKLRAWLQLEDVRDKLTEAAKIKNRDNVEMYLCEYISIAIPIAVSELRLLNWNDIARLFRLVYNVNLPNTEYPLIKPRPNKNENSEDNFDYPGRSWFMWLHTLARCYGWAIEYVAELEVNDAIALMQEILFSEQMEREWQWGTTELAYPYDSNTKTSKFHPLKRPEWMQMAKKVKEIKTVKMLKSALPVGVVMRWDNGKFTATQ